MKLANAPDKYDRDDQARMRGALERADDQNLKRGVDLDLGVKVAALSFAASLAGGSGPQFDASASAAIGVVVGGSALLWSGAHYGLCCICEDVMSGASALYLLGNGAVALMGETSSAWSAPTTTPGASNWSVAHNGTDYRVYAGASVDARCQFKALILRMA